MVRRLIVSAVFVSFSLCAACLPCCGDTQAGDVNQAPIVEPLVFHGAGWEPVEAGSTFPTITGGQGFTMMVVGARAQNVDTCGVQLNVKLVRDDTHEVVYDVTQERNLSRVSETTAETNDGNGDQGLQLIPCGGGIETACPVPVTLEVTVTDRLGHTATSTVSGKFECGPRYSECTPDGGVDGGP